MQLSLLTYGAEMFKGDACRTARMLASRTCAEVYERMKELVPDLPLAVPGSPIVGTKRKSSAPQKRKNATQVKRLFDRRHIWIDATSPENVCPMH